MEEEKSSFEDSPVESEKGRVPFDAVPNANTSIDQGQDRGEIAEDSHIDTPSLVTSPIKGERPSALTKTRSQRSYAGADGYTRFSEDQEKGASGANGEIPEADVDSQKKFEVTWDGDDDPMSPKSMSLARKWVIVLVMASSSLCVYVLSSLLPSDTMHEKARVL